MAAALAALALCVLSYVSANQLFLSGRGGGLFGVTTWLWAASIGAIVLAGLLWPAQAAVPVSKRGSRAVALEGLIFVSIVAAAFATRLYDLGELPFAIHPDEILTGRNAINAFINGNVSPFITVWSGINLPALWFAAVAASLDHLGHSLTALRVPDAVLGATASIPLYAFLRESWGRVAAAFGAALFATGASSVHYSRVTLNNHVATLFWIACFYFSARGWRTGRAAPWVMAGVMGGLAEHTYYGTRLLPFVLVAFFVYLLVLDRRSAARTLGSLLWLGAGYVAAFGPLLAHHLKTPGSYLGRGVGVLTLRSVPFDGSAVLGAASKILALTADNLLAVSTVPDNSSHYWAPLLRTPEAALLSIGVLLLVWTWRHPPAFLLLLSGAAVIFVGGVLVPPPRALQHWTPAFACFYAAAAVPVAAWWRRVHTLGRFWRSAAGAVVALALAGSAFLNVRFYFRDYQATRPEFEFAAVSRAGTPVLASDSWCVRWATDTSSTTPSSPDISCPARTRRGSPTFMPSCRSRFHPGMGWPSRSCRERISTQRRPT